MVAANRAIRCRLPARLTLVPQNSVTRFDDRAADYVRYRPSYPSDAIDHILDGLDTQQAIAADVGAGTGISARLLADRGLHVVALEPGAAMRAAAAPHPRVQWVAAVAESTALARCALHLVLSAQSFHWFRPADALTEFARILEPAGRLAIMWNRPSATDSLTVGYGEAIAAIGGDTGTARMAFDADAVQRSALFTPAVRAVFANTQRLDLDGLLGRAESASYVPKSDETRARLRTLLASLHAGHADEDGFVTMVYDTEVFIAHRV